VTLAAGLPSTVTAASPTSTRLIVGPRAKKRRPRSSASSQWMVEARLLDLIDDLPQIAEEPAPDGR
jgi:hypothetical protein